MSSSKKGRKILVGWALISMSVSLFLGFLLKQLSRKDEEREAALKQQQEKE